MNSFLAGNIISSLFIRMSIWPRVMFYIILEIAVCMINRQ